MALKEIQTSTLAKQSKRGMSRAETSGGLGPGTCKDLGWASGQDNELQGQGSPVDLKKISTLYVYLYSALIFGLFPSPPFILH